MLNLPLWNGLTAGPDLAEWPLEHPNIWDRHSGYNRINVNVSEDRRGRGQRCGDAPRLLYPEGQHGR
jgi:hypothetical protein